MRRTLAATGFGLLFVGACAPQGELGDLPPLNFSRDSQANVESEGGSSAKARRLHHPKKPARNPRSGCEKPNPEAPSPEAPNPEAPNPEAPNPEAPNPEESCLFGDSYRTLRDSAAFARLTHEIIDESRLADLADSQALQLVRAVQVAYEDVADLTGALASVDQGEVNRLVLVEVEGTRSFVVYEYGAGDNSYGAAFEAEGTEPVVEVQDGDLLACSILGEPRGARLGSACGGGFGDNCDSGLVCLDFDEDEGAGVCAEGP